MCWGLSSETTIKDVIEMGWQGGVRTSCFTGSEQGLHQRL
jgi:hypothetical protein